MIQLRAIRHPFLASEAKVGGFSQNALALAERISIKTSWRKLPDMINKGMLLEINMPKLRLMMAQAILDSAEIKVKDFVKEKTLTVSKEFCTYISCVVAFILKQAITF